MTGGAGFDSLTGGAGLDRFVFGAVGDISLRSGGTWVARDVVVDFDVIDLLDFSAIDANSKTAKDDAFNFIGDRSFGGAAGQLRYVDTHTVDGAGMNVFLLEGDTNGDRVADFQLEVHMHGQLGATDFVF